METTPSHDACAQHALDLIRSSTRVLLTGHMRPDGDCLGSQAALAPVLEALGKEVFVLNPDRPDPQFDFLTDQRRFGVYRGADLPAHDLVVLLDGCELSRCGRLGPVLAAAPSRKLVVDHHIHVGEEWWDAAYVDVTASATGLLVYRIARALSVDLDLAAARGIFTALVTDTGWFKYKNTDAETLRVAGELVAGGVDAAALFGSIYQRHGSGHPRAVGRMLDRLEYHADGRLAVLDVPHEPGAEHVEADDVLDLVRSVAAVEVVLFLREAADGTCRLSLRSKSEYDVCELARRFGGGGHARASGATISGNLDDVRDRLVLAAVEHFGGAA